jgi:hypothetical protein
MSKPIRVTREQYAELLRAGTSSSRTRARTSHVRGRAEGPTLWRCGAPDCGARMTSWTAVERHRDELRHHRYETLALELEEPPER